MIEHSDCRIATKSDERPCATTSAHILEMETYLVELIIVFEGRTAYIADFVPDWHFRFIFNDRCSELVLDRRHVRTMFRDHVLYVSAIETFGWVYVLLEDRFLASRP